MMTAQQMALTLQFTSEIRASVGRPRLISSAEVNSIEAGSKRKDLPESVTQRPKPKASGLYPPASAPPPEVPQTIQFKYGCEGGQPACFARKRGFYRL